MFVSSRDEFVRLPSNRTPVHADVDACLADDFNGHLTARTHRGAGHCGERAQTVISNSNAGRILDALDCPDIKGIMRGTTFR